MKPPAFQFYVDDFLGGTMHFTDAEVGLYARLLCIQWSTGGLPDNDPELSSYGKGDTPLARIKAKFRKGEDGLLRNPRMEDEREKQIAYRNRQADFGRKGGLAKATLSGPLGKPKRTIKPPSPSPSPNSESVYDLYPRKVARGDALKAIQKVLVTVPIQHLLDRTKAFAAATAFWPAADRQFIPHPATWFNRGSYDDDPETWKRHDTHQKRNDRSFSQRNDYSKVENHG